jgi:hypothetical protein
VTDLSFLDRNAEAALAEVERLIDRASYYKERQETKQALVNYVDALNAYAKFAKANTEAITVKMPIDINLNPRNTAIIYSRTLFALANLIAAIMGCYEDPVKKAFLAEKIKIISQDITNYESEFDADQLERSENIRNLVSSYQGLINSNQSALEEFKNKPIKELDEVFAKIRSALSDISDTKVCPVTLDSTGGGCFIATAAYSTSTHPDLDTFRQYRDEKLLTNSLGKQLVSLYYKIGPQIAQYIESKPAIKRFLRQHLARLAQWMRNE